MDLKNKLQLVLASVDAVEKRGTNDAQHYKFVKATDVAREVRKALIEHHVGFAYSIKDIKHWEKLKLFPDGTSQVGMYMCQVIANVSFIDLEADINSPGSSCTIEAVGWGSDPLDKAPYKAITGSLKYALRMQFLIPDESDPEVVNEEEKEVRPQVQRRTSPPRPEQVSDDSQYFANDDLPFLDETTLPHAVERQRKEWQQRPSQGVQKMPAPRQSKGPITEAQGKMLFAIAMSKKWEPQDYWSWINEQGFKRDRDIPMERFKEIKEALEKTQ